MKRVLSILLFILIWVGTTFSQTVTIENQGFRNYLMANFTSYFDMDMDLILDSASSYSGGVNCSNQGLTSIEGIQYFTGLTQIICSENELISLPDLSNCQALQMIQCDKNAITLFEGIDSLPQLNTLIASENDITTFPTLTFAPELQSIYLDDNNIVQTGDLTGLETIITLSLSNNQLTSVGELNENTPLQVLWLQNNQLVELPDLAPFSGISDLQLAGNQLTFEDFIPLTDLSNFASFSITPQNELEITAVGGAVEFDQISIEHSIDENITSNEYHWRKLGNGQIIGSERTLVFDSIQLTEQGEYFLEITNNLPALSSVTLTSGQVSIAPEPCFDIQALSIDGTFSCANLGSIEVSGVIGAKGIETIFTVDSDGNQDSGKALKKGDYKVYVTDEVRCTYYLGSTTLSTEDCDHIFTPDGDGINDEFFVEESGDAKVYAPGGQLIREFRAPGAWDGKDDSGNAVSLDLYTIVINGSDAIQVTVVR